MQLLKNCYVKLIKKPVQYEFAICTGLIFARGVLFFSTPIEVYYIFI